LIIPMIIQTVPLHPSGAVWTDEAFNVSRPDPSGAVQGGSSKEVAMRPIRTIAPLALGLVALAVAGCQRPSDPTTTAAAAYQVRSQNGEWEATLYLAQPVRHNNGLWVVTRVGDPVS
jgi:hypothetical protein